MTKDSPRARLLIALLHLSRRPALVDLSSLVEEAGLDVYSTLEQLLALQRRGWVDARRLRLTLPGLALAVALDEPAAQHPETNQVERWRRTCAA